jgi:hypothetical protein
MRIAAPPGAIGQPHVLASVLPTQFGSINEYTVEVAQCPRTERQKSSLDAGLECCESFTTADILSLTAFV